MRLIILKTIKMVCFFIILFSFLNCNKSDSENQITITINSIDKETGQRRVNMYDTVEIRKEGIGYLTKTFKKVGEYVTDSTGAVSVKIDSTTQYSISVKGANVLGGYIYYPGQLKGRQEVDIETVSLENM
jgi:hypothetical protein